MLFQDRGLEEGSTNFPKIQESHRNYTRLEDDMKQVSYCALINTVLKIAAKKFSRHGDLEPRICVSLFFKAHDAAYFFFILLYGVVGNPGHRASSDFILIGNDPKEE
jgi:hypothetical protein